MVLAEVLARRGLGPGSEAAQGGYFAGAGHAHENGRDPGESDVLGLQHAERDAGRDARVYRVAAALERRQPGLGRHGMPADHHVTRPPQAWTPRGRMGRFRGHGFLPFIRSSRIRRRRAREPARPSGRPEYRNLPGKRVAGAAPGSCEARSGRNFGSRPGHSWVEASLAPASRVRRLAAGGPRCPRRSRCRLTPGSGNQRAPRCSGRQ